MPSVTLSRPKDSSRSSWPSITWARHGISLRAASVRMNSKVFDVSYRTSWRRIRACTAASTSASSGYSDAACVMTLRAYAVVWSNPGMSTSSALRNRVAARVLVSKSCCTDSWPPFFRRLRHRLCCTFMSASSSSSSPAASGCPAARVHARISPGLGTWRPFSIFDTLVRPALEDPVAPQPSCSASRSPVRPASLRRRNSRSARGSCSGCNVVFLSLRRGRRSPPALHPAARGSRPPRPGR